jgi:hypothetical protein
MENSFDNLDSLENVKTMKHIRRLMMNLKILMYQMTFFDANENPYENGVNRYLTSAEEC